jgi:preprotein translocase YajC subunit
MSFLIIIVLFVIAWVVLILPKQRELKRHNAFVQSLAAGDEVITGSGIYGTLD